MALQVPNTLMVETAVFVDLIATQKQTSAEIIHAMKSISSSVNEQSKSLQETRGDVTELKLRVKTLEDRTKMEEQAPARKSARIANLPQVNVAENGKYRCPKCLKYYSAGYVLVHMGKKNNRNCVAKP